MKQHKGTAMEPRHSCSYADIAVDYVMFHRNQWVERIGMWARFRDDIIYCSWLGSQEELLQFDAWLNELDPYLKFTLEF